LVLYFIAIPAQGLIEFKDHLSDMLERYGTDTDEQPQPNLPESKSFRAENKTFYFDCGSNARGVFLKVSEVRQNRYRTSITIPEKYLKQFRDQVNEFVDSIGDVSAESGDNAAAGPVKTEADNKSTNKA
jgi:hypothetical protein